MRHPSILQTDESLLLVIDYQERMVPAMHGYEHVTSEILKIIQGFHILHIPVLATEQYPKGLGHTLSEISQLLTPENVIEKIAFSCCGSHEFWDALKRHNPKQIVVAGVETHVCVIQTVLDLIQNEYQVHVPVSTVASRNPLNRDNALRRLENAGAIITTVESALFELMIRAGSDEFKQIQKLII